MWVLTIDHNIMHFLNRYAGSSALVNHAVNFIAGTHIFNSLPIMSLYFFLWLSKPDKEPHARSIILATLLGCFVALVAARILNHVIPFHPRPIADPSFSFHPLAGQPEPQENALYKLNSFPSDTAALFFGFAMGIFLLSKRLGTFVFLYVSIFIALPRLYLGLHYLSDLLVGALLGIGSVALCVYQKGIRERYDALWLSLLKRSPPIFYTVLYIISFELAEMFTDFRKLINWFINHVF